jgi:hypothetical protein
MRVLYETGPSTLSAKGREAGERPFEREREREREREKEKEREGEKEKVTWRAGGRAGGCLTDLCLKQKQRRRLRTDVRPKGRKRRRSE